MFYLLFLFFFLLNTFAVNDNNQFLVEKMNYMEEKSERGECVPISFLQNTAITETFKNFVNQYFSQLISGDVLLEVIDKINYLVQKYQKRIAKEHQNYEFTQEEYLFLESILKQFFGKEMILCPQQGGEMQCHLMYSFVDSAMEENTAFLTCFAYRFQSLFNTAYRNVFGENLYEWTEKELYACDNESLIYYFINKNQDKAISSIRAERFFSDIHSSPLYFARFVNAMNTAEKQETFIPFVLGGDLSDRPLLPLFKKQEYAKFFDLLLNQIHLINGLYVNYCLRTNQKEKIFLLATLGNHEELNVNLYNDKAIFNSCLNSELKEYFIWSVNALTNTFPVQIVFVDGNEENDLLITSMSHAVGKQHINKYCQVSFANEDSGVYCYKVHLKENRKCHPDYKQCKENSHTSALEFTDEDFVHFKEFLAKNNYLSRELYIKAYFDFLHLSIHNLTSHILTRMDPFAGSHQETKNLSFSFLLNDNNTNAKAYVDEDFIDRQIKVHGKQNHKDIFLQFSEKRGFKVNELSYMFPVFKYIEQMNIHHLFPSLDVSNKKVTYHSCCGHQHDEDTLRNGFYIDFKNGKIFLSSFYYHIDAKKTQDKLYFSMCATCMNLYYLQFKKYIDIFQARYPEIFCLLEVDFNTENHYCDIEQLQKENLLTGNCELDNHDEIVAFIKNKIANNPEMVERLSIEMKKKSIESLNEKDKILYSKIESLLLYKNNEYA